MLSVRSAVVKQPTEINAFPGKDLLEELAGHKAELCLSIYIPTHSGGKEVEEGVDLLLFKEKLQQAGQQLIEEGQDGGLIEQMLAPASVLLKQGNFWHNQSSGLATFISPGHFKYCRLPFSPKEEILVNGSFLIKPLMPLINSSEYFYILSLGRHVAHLYYADAFGIRYIDIPELPSGMKEMDRVLAEKVLGREQAPLLLAGVEDLLPLYREASTYRHIVGEELRGSYEQMEPPALYKTAMEKMEPFFKRQLKRSLISYFDRLSTAFSAPIAEEVIPAAFYGQIETLFIRENAHLWGHFDEMANKLVIHETREAGDDCLIDKTVLQTITHSGEIYVLCREDMPSESPMAAVLRYS